MRSEQIRVDGPAKSCTKRMVETCGNPIHNGINYRFQLVIRISLARPLYVSQTWKVGNPWKSRKSSHTKNSKAVKKKYGFYENDLSPQVRGSSLSLG